MSTTAFEKENAKYLALNKSVLFFEKRYQKLVHSCFIRGSKHLKKK